ncbi:MAG: apolipoprotein N-acyltransferase [Pseudomonadota bacterium]
MNLRSDISKAMDWFPGALSGLMLTLAFPEPGIGWIAWISLTPLIISLRTLGPRQAFIAGLACGLVHYLTLIYWIVPTIHQYGGLPLVLAVPTLAVLCLYLALYTGCFALAVSTLKPSALMPLKAAALWTGLEFIRSWMLTGFPWGLAGYSQYRNLCMIQIADITGVYGVSFLIVLSGCTLSLFWPGLPEFCTPGKRQGRTSALASLILALALGTSFWYGTWRLGTLKQDMLLADTARISVVQGNIEQAVKWEASFQETTVQTYCSLSRTTFPENPDLIIWPETSLPFYYSWDRKLSDTVDACVREGRTWFLFGSPAFEGKEPDYRIFNRAYMLNRFSIVTGTYDKIHLVPFGEYVPFGNCMGFLGKLTEQTGDFSPGPGKVTPLHAGKTSVGVLICFEIIFASLARDHVAMGSNLLVTLTNDAWFGRTSAPMQHFSLAVFRAVENRRSVARAANTGISGFIDPTGRILGTTDLFTATALTQTLPCMKNHSPYTTLGDAFALLCLAASVLILLAGGVGAWGKKGRP